MRDDLQWGKRGCAEAGCKPLPAAGCKPCRLQAPLEAQTMRRFLIGLTLALLVVVSIGVGVAVALWPSWRHVLQ